MALLGWHEGYKFFWGLPNRFPFAPQKIGIGRNWAPAQFAFLCSLQFWKHSPHRHRYLHSAQSKQQCYLLIETREYGCLQGRLLRALPHSISSAHASRHCVLGEIQTNATLPLPCIHVRCRWRPPL